MRIVMLVGVFLCLVGCAYASTLQLPAGMKDIGEEAFYGDISLDKVVLPEGIERIEKKAFSGSSVTVIYLPDSLKYIAEDALDQNPNIVIRANEGSVAYTWAQTNGFDILSETPKEWFEFASNEDEDTCSIIGYNGDASADIVIPAKDSNGKTVTQIWSKAFEDRSDLTGRLFLSDTLEYIGAFAFYGCSNLQGNLYIPDTVKTIDMGAFYNCSGFTGNLVFPEGLQYIGLAAFSGCSGFTGDLIIPDSVTSIGGTAFSDCTGLDGKLILSNALSSVDYSTFRNCSALKGDLSIPNSVEKIESYAFCGCKNLSGSLSLGENITEIGDYAFSGCSSITGRLVLSASLTTIGDQAFSKCTMLSGNLVIPDNVISIGQYAFRDCSNFNGCLVIGKHVETIDQAAFKGCCGFTGGLIIPDSVISIGDYAFSDCSGFTGELVIGNSVTSIGKNAFDGCSSFTGDLIIPNSVISIGQAAFFGCSGFEGNLKFGNSLSSLGTSAFCECKNFSGDLLLPDCLSIIPPMAFYKCSGFDGKLVLGKNTTSIQNSAFFECVNLAGNLIIPDSVTTIGSQAFSKCEKFTGSLIIPDSVQSIGIGAFRYCSGFNGDLIIGNNVKTIDANAFYRCVNFSGSLKIGRNVAYLGYLPFYLDGFSTCYFPDGITSMDDSAFSNYYDLKTVYAVQDSYAWNWLINNGFETKLVAWDGNYSSLPEEKQIAGFFSNDSMNIALDEPPQIPAGRVYSLGADLYRVTITISGWSQDESGNDRYASYMCSELHTNSLSLNDWDVFILDTSKAPLNVPGEYTINLWASTSDANGSGVKLDSMTVNVKNPHIIGAFTEHALTYEVGGIREIPEGTVTAEEELYRVSFTIDDYVNANGNDIYASYVCSELYTTELRLKDWDAFYLDTSKEPLNIPGQYTVNLWASTIEGEDIKLDSMTVNIGYRAYVQGTRVDTYPDSVSTEPNGFVDNTDPVLVILEENGRFFIQMKRTIGDHVLRWVEKNMVGNSYWQWTGYLHTLSAETYPDPTSSDSNGMIYNDEYVSFLVIGAEGNRYQIQTPERTCWVEKKWIKNTAWNGYIITVMPHFTDNVIDQDSTAKYNVIVPEGIDSVEADISFYTMSASFRDQYNPVQTTISLESEGNNVYVLKVTNLLPSGAGAYVKLSFIAGEKIVDEMDLDPVYFINLIPDEPVRYWAKYIKGRVVQTPWNSVSFSELAPICAELSFNQQVRLLGYDDNSGVSYIDYGTEEERHKAFTVVKLDDNPCTKRGYIIISDSIVKSNCWVRRDPETGEIISYMEEEEEGTINLGWSACWANETVLISRMFLGSGCQNPITLANGVTSVTPTIDQIVNTVDDNDITYIHLFCHHGDQGFQMIYHSPASQYMTDAEYARQIKRIPGNVIITLDACHSETFVNLVKQPSNSETYLYPGRYTVISPVQAEVTEDLMIAINPEYIYGGLYTILLENLYERLRGTKEYISVSDLRENLGHYRLADYDRLLESFGFITNFVDLYDDEIVYRPQYYGYNDFVFSYEGYDDLQ